mgnify:CR=1 FL=1
MKKNLDLNRLGMVIRWDVLNNWTYNCLLYTSDAADEL